MTHNPNTPPSEQGDKPVAIKMPPFKLSKEALREMAKVTNRTRRFYQTAHLYTFD